VTRSALRANRRRFLGHALRLAGAAWLAPFAVTRAIARPRFTGFPFSLGVASGSPGADGVVLWTRLAPEPLNGGGMTGESVEVGWEVAADRAFRQILRSGRSAALAEHGHSVHVEVDGLLPGRDYWYRFHAGAEQSPVGHTRTLPAADALPRRLRFAFCSCQNFEHGYYGAYRHMAEEDLDLVLHLGDYIYESNWGSDPVRRHAGPEPRTLVEYRNRHAQYKTDRDLQRMHAAAPWLLTWDDHEVDNDYANDRAEDLDPGFLARRAAAYLAYFEHMPLRGLARPREGGMRLYDRCDFGRLARFHVLDDRQYRSHQACPKPGRGGANVVSDCAELFDPGRSLLGFEQEGWLDAGLRSSPARWDVIAQQTLMARVDGQRGEGEKFWTDGWDGYPAARARLLGQIARREAGNAVVVGGDLHANWVCDLKQDFLDPAAPVIATEFVGTSIASFGRPQSAIDEVLPENPHVRLAETTRRGYTVMEIEAARCSVKLRVVDDAADPATGISTRANFIVESGRPGAQRA
jgi:alkaline phosphatase D